jgi:hypothetical protein
MFMFGNLPAELTSQRFICIAAYCVKQPYLSRKFALDPERYRQEERAFPSRGPAGAGLWTHSQPVYEAASEA